jgi:hypothetical protein
MAAVSCNIILQDQWRSMCPGLGPRPSSGVVGREVRSGVVRRAGHGAPPLGSSDSARSGFEFDRCCWLAESNNKQTLRVVLLRCSLWLTGWINKVSELLIKKHVETSMQVSEMHRRCSRASLLPHRSRSLVLLRSFIAAEHRDCTPIMRVHCFLFFFPLSLSLSLSWNTVEPVNHYCRETVYSTMYLRQSDSVSKLCCALFPKGKSWLTCCMHILHEHAATFFLSSLFSSSDVMRCEFLGGWERETERERGFEWFTSKRNTPAGAVSWRWRASYLVLPWPPWNEQTDTGESTRGQRPSVVAVLDWTSLLPWGRHSARVGFLQLFLCTVAAHAET